MRPSGSVEIPPRAPMPASIPSSRGETGSARSLEFEREPPAEIGGGARRGPTPCKTARGLAAGASARSAGVLEAAGRRARGGRPNRQFQSPSRKRRSRDGSGNSGPAPVPQPVKSPPPVRFPAPAPDGRPIRAVAGPVGRDEFPVRPEAALAARVRRIGQQGRAVERLVRVLQHLREMLDYPEQRVRGQPFGIVAVPRGPIPRLRPRDRPNRRNPRTAPEGGRAETVPQGRRPLRPRRRNTPARPARRRGPEPRPRPVPRLPASCAGPTARPASASTGPGCRRGRRRRRLRPSLTGTGRSGSANRAGTALPPPSRRPRAAGARTPRRPGAARPATGCRPRPGSAPRTAPLPAIPCRPSPGCRRLPGGGRRPA